LGERINTLEQNSVETQEHLNGIAEHLRNAQSQLDRTVELQNDLSRAGEHLKNLQIQVDGLRELHNDFDRAGKHLKNLQTQVDGLTELRRDLSRAGEHLKNLQTQVDGLTELRRDLSRAGEHLKNLQLQADRTTDLRRDFERAGEHLKNLQIESGRIGEGLRNLQQRRDLSEKRLQEQVQAEIGQRAAVQRSVELIEQRQTSDAAFLKAELAHQAGLLQSWLVGTQDVRPAGRQRQHRKVLLAKPDEHQLDAFYFSFENRFRGPRKEIKKRVGFYLPFLRKARAGTKTRPVLDVGCGRGEWLELLREQKLEATGVDLNEAMVAQCKERRLKVVQGDAIEFLRGLPDRSQGAVTGFHIIEHLPLEVLIQLLMHSRRVLKPGGIAIFESPNCKNLIVGACNFNIDPTHRNPIFPETAQFMLETQGFERVKLEYLSPVDTSGLDDIEEEPAHIRELLYGPQDFAVIGYRPAGR